MNDTMTGLDNAEERTMRIGIVGAGRIGGNAGQLFARAGHEVFFSGSRDPDGLEKLAGAVGRRAQRLAA